MVTVLYLSVGCGGDRWEACLFCWGVLYERSLAVVLVAAVRWIPSPDAQVLCKVADDPFCERTLGCLRYLSYCSPGGAVLQWMLKCYPVRSASWWKKELGCSEAWAVFVGCCWTWHEVFLRMWHKVTTWSVSISPPHSAWVRTQLSINWGKDGTCSLHHLVSRQRKAPALCSRLRNPGG